MGQMGNDDAGKVDKQPLPTPDLGGPKPDIPPPAEEAPGADVVVDIPVEVVDEQGVSRSVTAKVTITGGLYDLLVSVMSDALSQLLVVHHREPHAPADNPPPAPGEGETEGG